MQAFEFELLLRSAVMVTRPQAGDPNSEVALPYIPGSTMRGLFVGLYTGERKADNPDFRRLFLDGRVRFLNAYPMDEGDGRMLPTPLSWHREKDGDDRLLSDFAGGAQGTSTATWSGIDDDFCTIFTTSASEEDDDERQGTIDATLLSPSMLATVHTARSDRQRVTDVGSTVFRYDALAPDQRLKAVVLGEQAELETLVALLPSGSVVRVGRAQNAGYGEVEVCYDREQPLFSEWQEFEQLAERFEPKDKVVVTLLSDAIILDQMTGATSGTLEPILGIKHKRAYMRRCLVGGFNRTWNLPLPQERAIGAGSVFVYGYDEALLNRLKEFAISGIGQRREDGFGRIGVQWHGTKNVKAAEVVLVEPYLGELSAESRKIAETLMQRIYRKELDARLIKTINKIKMSGNIPQNTQLNRLRSVVRKMMQQKEFDDAVKTQKLSVLSGYLKKLRKVGRDQLQSARYRNGSFFDYLEKLAESPQRIWDDLGVTQIPSFRIGNVRGQGTDEDVILYSCRLIDGVARRALKEETNG